MNAQAGSTGPSADTREGQPAVPLGPALPAPRRTQLLPPRHSHPGDLPADPVESKDPLAAADAATSENLLRCWVRERAITPEESGSAAPSRLLIDLPASGTALTVPVRHWSATGLHRFGVPTLTPATSAATAVPRPVDAVTLAALLSREATDAHHTCRAETLDLLSRVADSVRQTARFLTARRAEPEAPEETSVFLDGEQSLLLGHPLHPAPKSRDGLDAQESRRYAPELRGRFPLHWYAVDRSLLAADSAWTERGRTVSAERLAAVLAGTGPDAPVAPEGTVPLPLHPRQAHAVAQRCEVRQLLDQRLLFDLGPAGKPWYPTSSVRTVHQPGTPVMLKLSLALRITNSRRENLRKELHRGVEVHRLLRTGLADQWRAAFPKGPGFDIVRDPAWLAVDAPDGRPLPGLDAVIRHNPFGPGDRVHCLAALTSRRPWPGEPSHLLTSPLARTVCALARRTGRSPAAVSTEWLLRYLHVVVRPVLWLDAAAGVALEAHQQNTLVFLDAAGWPEGGRYRDNQGYYLRTSRRDALQRRLPGIGEASDSFVDDAVTDERFAYYLGVNNVLGLIGALGAEGLADEELLLAAFRRFLTQCERAVPPTDAASPLPSLLLHSPTLRGKANLLTRLHGLDELVGPVDTQSVYVTLPNPLARP